MPKSKAVPCKWNPSKEVKDLIFRFFVYIFYSVVGAAIFMSLENAPIDEDKYNQESKTAMINIDEYLSKLRLNSSYMCPPNDTNENLLARAREVLAVEKMLPKKPDEWDFGRGWWLTFEICTTIGYGSTPPTTQGARIFCVFYAIIGIPIFLLFLKSVGEVLNRKITKLVYWIEKKCLNNTEEPRHLELKMLIGFSCVLIITILVASFLKDSPDNATYIDSIYAVIVTYTTVGFGDFMLENVGEVILGLALVSAVLDGVTTYLEKLDEERRKRQGKGCCKCFGTGKANNGEDGDAYGMDNKARDLEIHETTRKDHLEENKDRKTVKIETSIEHNERKS